MLIWVGDFTENAQWKKIRTYLNRGGVVLFLPSSQPAAHADKKSVKNSSDIPHWNTLVSYPKEKPMTIAGNRDEQFILLRMFFRQFLQEWYFCS